MELAGKKLKEITVKTKNSRESIGTRINLFDNTEQTVYDFNQLFPECPLGDQFQNSSIVIIGDYMGGDCREIDIAGEKIRHKMWRDTLYGMDRDLFYFDETEKELETIYGYPV